MGLRHASLFDAATAGALISQRLAEQSLVAPVKREAVLDAGSFDSRFRVAEDSDLGLRLSRKGYYVRYVPEARAIDQHLPFTIPDLIRRAELYGETQLALLRNTSHTARGRRHVFWNARRAGCQNMASVDRTAQARSRGPGSDARTH